MKDIKLQIKNLTKVYENGDGIRNINLDIYEGEILTLLGPSGCGKSTILRCLGGFQSVDEGQIIIDGQDNTAISANKRNTSMVFQGYNLWSHMTVYENLAFGLKLRKFSKKEIKEKITSMLALLKLPGVEKKYPSQLSGGQQQRIAIGRSLLLEPAVLLLDEPLSALDAKIRQQMREELKRIQSETKVTVVFVTHDQEEAMSLSDRIVVMDKGEIAQIDTPYEIYENPVNRYVASFIGEMNFILNDNKVKAFRPEDVTISVQDGDYYGEVEEIMNVGHYSIVYLNLNNQRIKLYINKEQAHDYQKSASIYFTINKYKEYEEI
ncbi:spermidine/putrescine ABC transporter ATP-binding protein [Vagococcus lutrae]|uniref:ABC transporter ATP-binding protein n=1 Tax=Vagococcus lutrae TaxID=81947 RepID=UPI001928798A|nr:ABC transporter ATP-binding protein [Vagococcus lutrae]GEQ60843.1 spermidine/putrescine ABC transporter ATP-binding protein [Vagococcus lutrae]GEQ62737.1 spermidine/putrescine ABC transporter ATP-binding protein [Vagococcus lutrae]GEQ64485.1 spermidine/putrescine ABC transporter ATP-binding protein [Vagococcus lutrae]